MLTQVFKKAKQTFLKTIQKEDKNFKFGFFEGQVYIAARTQTCLLYGSGQGYSDLCTHGLSNDKRVLAQNTCQMKSDILKFMFVLGTERKMFCSNFFHFADERGLAEVCQLGHLTKKQKLLLFLNSPTMYLKYYLKGPLPVVSSILDKSLWTLATVWLTNKKL